MTLMNLAKKKIRDFYLKKRELLPPTEIARISRIICQKVLNLDEIKEKNSFATYLPINNEVDTNRIINGLHQLAKVIFVPCYFKDDGEYDLAKFTNWQALERGPYGILQPKKPKAVNPSIIEAAFIPGVAFSKEGVRLGYGKGVFDKLFANSGTLKIALAYDFQITDSIVRQKHDLLMDLIVTERQVYRFW